MFKRAIPKCTPDQQARQDRARELGCIACKIEWGEKEGPAAMPPEIHHLTRTGRQIGQDETVCLCQWHHRGICAPDERSSAMSLWWGPSLAKGSKPFHARYGSNDELLAYQNKLIGEGN